MNNSEAQAVSALAAAVMAILVEVSPGHRPHSSDSYLPQHLVDAARVALKELLEATR